jgi:hypothetical protein
MRIGGSLFLIAVGAILAFAVHADTKGVNLNIVGLILMIVGGIGLALTLQWVTSRRRTDVIHEPNHTVYVTPTPTDPLDGPYSY